MIKELYNIRAGIQEIGWQLESWTCNQGDLVILRFIKFIDDDNSRKLELMVDEEDLGGEDFIKKLKQFLTSAEKVGDGE